MTKLPSRLRRLDAILADLPGEEEPMLLTELDGFLAGVIVCAEAIAPAEWLRYVAGGDGYEDPEDARLFATMLTAHHEGIARGLERGRYRPLLDVDGRNGDMLWEPWIEGFAEAMALRPESWTMPDDAPAADALAGIATLIDIARDTSDLPRDEIDDLTAQAPGLIPGWIALLHACVAPQAAPVAPDSRPAAVGRNAPCPCGSGAKWKKCCGLN